MTIEKRVTKLEKQASTSTGALAARIIAARAATYRHTATADLEALQKASGSRAMARLVHARRRAGVR